MVNKLKKNKSKKARKSKKLRKIRASSSADLAPPKRLNSCIIASSGPKQPQQSYHNLRKAWYKRLKASGFVDIEFTGDNGQPGRYSTDYSIGAIRAKYTPEAEEYWHRIGLFTQFYDWRTFKGPYNPAIARFVWTVWQREDTFQAVVNAFKAKSAPKRRLRNGKVEGPPSIFWVHTFFKTVLEPLFKHWCVNEGREHLIVDHDLGL